MSIWWISICLSVWLIWHAKTKGDFWNVFTTTSHAMTDPKLQNSNFQFFFVQCLTPSNLHICAKEGSADDEEECKKFLSFSHLPRDHHFKFKDITNFSSFTFTFIYNTRYFGFEIKTCEKVKNTKKVSFYNSFKRKKSTL